MRNRSGMTCRAMFLAACAAIAVSPYRVEAQALAQDSGFDVPARDMGGALTALARQAGREIHFSSDLTRGLNAPALRGRMPLDEALTRLLAGTGLQYRINANGAIVIERGEPLAGDAPAELEGVEILVTGTRIRGATTASPVIELTGKEIRDAGFTDLGQVIRSIPQNYAGGQNPGVALGAGGINNGNASSGSALNLRGLGPDATLTLLNGRRLSYNGFIQAVDVSVVPIGALNRIEIIADGASAIYGSDAVGGVANIILRRDLNSIETTGRISLPTDGGGREYQFSATGGATWRSGGFIAGYEYTDADAIFSDQRSYTEYMPDPAQIYPSRRQHSAIFSGHQDIADFAELQFDGLYTRRNALNVFYTLPTSRPQQGSTTEIFALAPSIRFALPGDWSMTLGGNYGRDETVSRSRTFDLAGAVLRESATCYCNTSYSIEVDAEGPLLELPGGDLRVAVGAGYRRNEFESRSLTGGATISGEQGSHYAFGEFYAPLIGPDQQIAGINRLTATAALRYENYGDVGDIATPRLGLIYEPTQDISLRGSWGRSFKTPTLLQQFQDYAVILYPATVLGASGFPAGSTVLFTSGGNRDLRPERAETWSATVALHPRAVPALHIELSYFDVDYRDRVLQPIGTRPRTFIDPAYAEFLLRNPSADLQASTIPPRPACPTPPALRTTRSMS